MTDNRQDTEHLRLLTIFHYIVGVITALFSLLPGIHLGIGLWMLLSPEAIQHGGNGSPPPEFVGWVFVVLGGAFILIGELLAILIIYSGRLIARRERYLFSFVIAALMCFFVPFGTILGVFTLIVLSRHSVKQLYGQEI
jgi:hypothetical protein